LQQAGESRLVPLSNRLSRLPWWALIAAILGLLFTWQLTTNATYTVIFGAIADGVLVTIFVTMVAYFFAALLGLVLAYARLSKNVFVYQVSTFYVEIIRGVPMLVLLLYVAFVFIPGAVDWTSGLGRSLVANDSPLLIATRKLVGGIALVDLGSLAHVITTLSASTLTSDTRPLVSVGQVLAGAQLRDVSNLARVIIALIIAYSAFISEIFRAGIESIEWGQMEAARSLGMSYWQAMRYIILPQAIRNVLPPLGNDFIAMLKDSSLVSVLGVRDITGQGRVYMASTFLTFQTYNVMAFLYLVMTLFLSMAVRWVERRMGQGRRSH
jgi:polar amino acid transport system permease protein